MWKIVDHACRRCFGRVLQREVGGKVEVRCSECGLEGNDRPETICCCGVEVGGKPGELECALNPDASDEVPQQVVVRKRISMAAKP